MRGTVGLYSQVIGACDDAGEAAKAVEIYALGVQDKVFTHWHAGEPFSLDLHMFSQATAVSAVRYVLQHEVGNFLPADLKIITGWGKHTVEGSVPTLLPRIESAHLYTYGARATKPDREVWRLLVVPKP
jgi:hypothetical protein